MYKLWAGLFLSLCLNAQMVDGVSVVVGNKAITLLDIKKEMQTLHVDEKKATNILIRQKLEAIEVEKRKIKVTDDEVYKELKQTAKRNGMSVEQFYTAVEETNGLTPTELKQKLKQKLQSQKLYSSISYSVVSQPTDKALQDYYELHKEKFTHPDSFDVTAYSAYDKNLLLKKLQNPMFLSTEISDKEQTLDYNKIPKPLAQLLQKTKDETFTKIIPNSENSFVVFYLKSKNGSTTSPFNDVKQEVESLLMAQKREEVLSDYFQRLQNSDNIKILRTLNAQR